MGTEVAWRILLLLSEKSDLTAYRVAWLLGINRTKIAKHLRLLKRHGLITTSTRTIYPGGDKLARKRGHQIRYWSLNSESPYYSWLLIGLDASTFKTKPVTPINTPVVVPSNLPTSPLRASGKKISPAFSVSTLSK